MLLLMVSEHVTLSVVQDVPQSTPGAMAHWSIAPSGPQKVLGSNFKPRGVQVKFLLPLCH
jgi:hypothetical protein